jgi:hypothetical protein
LAVVDQKKNEKIDHSAEIEKANLEAEKAQLEAMKKA